MRGAAVLEKCHARKPDVPVALVLVQTYVRHLARYNDAITVCEACLALTDDPHSKSRVYLFRGVAEAALCRSTRLTEEQRMYNKKSIESLYKSYSLDPHCPQTLYHLALRLASVGEIKKSIRLVSLTPAKKQIYLEPLNVMTPTIPATPAIPQVLT